MTEADLYSLGSSISHGLLSEYESGALVLQKRRVRSLEVELLEARLELGVLTYVLYGGVVEPDSDEDLRRDG